MTILRAGPDACRKHYPAGVSQRGGAHRLWQGERMRRISWDRAAAGGIGALGLAALALTAACGTAPATDPIAAANNPKATPASPTPTGRKDCEYVNTGDPARPVK